MVFDIGSRHGTGCLRDRKSSILRTTCEAMPSVLVLLPLSPLRHAHQGSIPLFAGTHSVTQVEGETCKLQPGFYTEVDAWAKASQ